MILKNEKKFKRNHNPRKRNLGPDLPVLKSSTYKFEKNTNSSLVGGSNRKDRSLEKKMDRTINSELNSGISGRNLSEFSIKFEGLSDTFSRNEGNDFDDGADLHGKPFMYKTDKFGRSGELSEIQRSKSATNQTKKIIHSEIQTILKNSLHEKRKPSSKKKDKSKNKMKIKKLKELKEQRSLGSSKIRSTENEKLNIKQIKKLNNKRQKEFSKDTNKNQHSRVRKKKRKIILKSGLKKTSNTNSDKKLANLVEIEPSLPSHKKSLSVTTPSQFKKIFKELNKGSKQRGKYPQTEKNSIRSKASSVYTDSKESSIRGISNSKTDSETAKGSKKLRRNQKSKFQNTDNSAESDPKSKDSTKKTTHKSHPSREASPEKVSLENKKKGFINPTFISPSMKIKGALEEKEDFQRDENFESFAMINEPIQGAKFDSFISPGMHDLKEALRAPQEDRGMRLDNGNFLF